MTDSRASLPESYRIPEVWSEPKQNQFAVFGNSPVAGPRHQLDLPRGDHPIQLYSLGTPNGQKITIMLEEVGLRFDAWKVDIRTGDQFGSGFCRLNPNSKIPAMIDYSQTPPLPVFESGSILLYLAEKTGKLVPGDPARRTECLNWLFWQVGTAPYVGGGFGHFYRYAPIRIEYAIDRFAMETKRILSVLDMHLDGRTYVCGDEYTIADIAIYPWVVCIDTGYNAKRFLDLDGYKHVARWMETMSKRDAVQRGMKFNYMRSVRDKTT